MLDDMMASGRTPARILIGNADAIELEEEINRYRMVGVKASLFGDETFEPPRKIDVVNLSGPATLFGVPLERVDQPRLVGVIAE